MPATELPASRRNDASAEYYYRRPLGLRELIPAIGIGIGAGLFAFYVTRLMLQRTPLRVHREARPATKRRPLVHGQSGKRTRLGNPAA